MWFFCRSYRIWKSMVNNPSPVEVVGKSQWHMGAIKSLWVVELAVWIASLYLLSNQTPKSKLIQFWKSFESGFQSFFHSIWNLRASSEYKLTVQFSLSQVRIIFIQYYTHGEQKRCHFTLLYRLVNVNTIFTNG